MGICNNFYIYTGLTSDCSNDPASRISVWGDDTTLPFPSGTEIYASLSDCNSLIEITGTFYFTYSSYVYNYQGGKTSGSGIPCPTPTPTPGLSPTPTQTPGLSPTPTLTPTIPYNLAICDIIFNFGGAIYGYVFSTNTSTNITTLFPPPTISSNDIAHTTTKLWMYDTSFIREYDITLSPFSATFSRDISLPSQIGAGLGVINNTTLVSSTGGDIIEIDITTSTAVFTTKFAMPTGRFIAGDMVYTYSSPNKLICSYSDFSTTWITQHDYTTGSVEVDVITSPTLNSPYGIFMSSGDLYVCDSDGDIYNFQLTSPYTLTYVDTSTNSIFGASQPPQCATIVLEPEPTPTPTPIVPTPTPTPIVPTPTPTPIVPTPTPTSSPSSCPPNCAGCGEEYSAYSETQCYTLLTEPATPPTTTLSLVEKNFIVYSSIGSCVYNPGYSVSGFTNFLGGDFILLPNVTLWKNISLNNTEGPLNRCGISTSSGSIAPPFNTWIGFSQCIDINETNTYYIGIGADNHFKLVVDGIEIVNTRLSIPYWYGPLLNLSRPFKRWNIYPLTLNSGNHIVELFYWNNGSEGSLGCEIYDNTLLELQNATLYQDLNIVFTTSGQTEVTIVQDNSGNYLASGYTCSSGYVYNSCTDECVKYEFCDICPEPIICPFNSYCISTGNPLYDGTYYSAGTFSDQTYWSGESNDYSIYFNNEQNCWCLSSELGGPCVLFGPTPCNNDCPDLCDSFFNPGPCPTPTPTPTQYCQPISFEAAFDCELPLTPTATVTGTPTPTPTPTPTATEICGGKAISVTVNILTPTPTATNGKMVATPTPSVQYNCNFDGTVVFNTFDDYIRCNGSKRFKDCVSGMLYHTTDVVLDPLGGTPSEGYVYQSFVNGVSTCITYEGFVSNIAGVNTIQLTQILGLEVNGVCSQCVTVNTPTPTPTLTSTPTPTPTTTLSVCYNYLIENSYINSQTFTYTSCTTGSPVDGVINSYGSTTICSSALPTTTSSFITITDIGLCN